MRKPKARKRTAFVPRIVFRATIAGASVVPICAMGCGSGGGGVGVASVGFDAGDASDGMASDAAIVHEAGGFSVAAIGFGDAGDGGHGGDAGHAGDGSSFTDGGDASDAASDVHRVLGVAVMAFEMPGSLSALGDTVDGG